jgi:hypothetical protein
MESRKAVLVSRLPTVSFFFFFFALSHLSTTHQPINKTGIWHDCDFYLHSVVLEAAKGNLMLIHPPSRAGHKATSSYSTLRPLHPTKKYLHVTT